MKKLLLRAFALIAAVLPLSVAEAAPKPPPVFGGWSPGKTFTFTVDTKLSAANQMGQVLTNVPVPKGVPDLQVGQQVTFTIGKKGELIGPGFKIAFQADAGSSNAFINKPKKGSPPVAAIVYKNVSTNEPFSVALNFFTFKMTNRIPTVTSVTYTLN
jgi:hypothetical protein